MTLQKTKALFCAITLTISLPVLSSAFVITNTEFQGGVSAAGNGAGSAYVFTGAGDARFHMDGYSAYIDELIEYYELVEYREEVAYVNSTLNNSLTDNMAYAVMYRFAMEIDTNDDGQTDEMYLPWDTISGSDWDNNGLIDVLERNPVVYHKVVGEIRLK